MRLAEIITETINPDQIEAIGAMRDMAQARAATLDLMFSNARAVQRRADLRQQVASAGTVKQLVQMLWSMKLSNEGLPTGISTSQAKKGIVYRR
jgi:hypothetical protein